MKYMLASLVLLLGADGVARSQTSAAGVHPGTAILDSMGIIAGAPEQTPKNDARVAPTSPGKPTASASTAARQQ